MEDRSGGVNGQRTRLRNQMTRLFRCSVQLQQSDGDHEVTVSSLIADKSEYWWHAGGKSGSAGAVRFHDPPRGRIFQRDPRASRTPRYAHPALPKTLTAGPGFIRVVGVFGRSRYARRSASPGVKSCASLGPIRRRRAVKIRCKTSAGNVCVKIKKIKRAWAGPVLSHGHGRARHRALSASHPRPLFSSVSSGTGSRSRQLVDRRVERAGRNHRPAITASPSRHGKRRSPEGAPRSGARRSR